ncbi:MAG: cupin domain-containing protein [Armatimonadota bacterium]
MALIHEDDVAASQHSDRWSTDLIGGEAVPTTSGFSLGVAEYHATEFGPFQVHEDQEAVYVVSGEGEMSRDGEILPLRPGVAIYVGAGVAHAVRRTGDANVKVVYAHGPV